MSSNPFFFVSIFLSAVLAFGITAFLVEMLISSLKKIPKTRTARLFAIARTLPFVSLSLDLISSSISVGYLFNPLNCSSCIQKVILTLFFPETKNYLYANRISLVNHLGKDTSHAFFQLAGIALVLLTLFLLCRTVFELVRANNFLKVLEMNSKACSRMIENPSVLQAIKKHRIKVVVIEAINVPFATWTKVVFIPKTVVNAFSQTEFEAVLAHEIEHIRWKDPQVRIAIELISLFFWWVPTSFWRKSLEFDQEVACDQSILQHGITQSFLASALLKVSKEVKNSSYQPICYLAQKKHDSLKRLQVMMDEPNPFLNRYEWLIFSLSAIFCIGLAAC